MSGLWLLSWRNLVHHRGRSLILVVCIGLTVFLPVTVQLLLDHYQDNLGARARATPAVVGAKGNRFNLTLAALYFRPTRLPTIPMSAIRDLRLAELATAIPIHVRFKARQHSIVGTSPEYFALRKLRPATGTLPLRLGDVVLGSTVAATLGIDKGDTLPSDATGVHDLAQPPTLDMRVTGVLRPSGGPDDNVVFVDIKTCWILEGLLHGHSDARQADDTEVFARNQHAIGLRPSVPSYARVTADNIASFHYHGDDSALPLSALITLPDSDKATTILKARINATAAWQMVVPTTVIDDLMRLVFRVKTLFDSFAVVLAATTTLLLGLQLMLSMQLRAREMTTLHRIGCSPRAVAVLYATEIAILVGLGLALAGLAVVLALALLPDLLRQF